MHQWWEGEKVHGEKKARSGTREIEIKIEGNMKER